MKSGQIDAKTIEAALGGEDYSTYKNVLNNYDVLQQELNELQSIDNKAKTQEQATRELEIKNKLEQIKVKADKLKSILQNKVVEKIDVDNIHLRDRESYLWDSYIGKLPNFVNDNLNNAKALQKIDAEAFVEGLWDDGKSSVNSESAEYVENENLESVENVGENGIIEETRVLTLDNLTKDILKTKPPYSPKPDKWISNGGSITIDNGDWVYTNSDGISVKYVDEYPDFKGAGLVIQEVDVGEFVNREVDKRKAKKEVEQNPNTEWHHPPNSNMLQEIDADIHKQFTHIGPISKIRRGE